jgi:hypothetical protein
MGRCLRSYGSWVMTRYPRFVMSGSHDFWDMALAPNGTILWIGRHDLVFNLWPDEDSDVM